MVICLSVFAAVPDYAVGSKLNPGGIIAWILHGLAILFIARL